MDKLTETDFFLNLPIESGWRTSLRVKGGRTGPNPGGRYLMMAMAILFASLVTASAAFSQNLLPNVDPAPWDKLLKEFVNDQHLVDYEHLQQEGRSRLNEYIARLGETGTQPLPSNETKALLINAYNAFTIQWVAESYPTESIWRTSSPFTQARHRLGGKMVSLDEIESELRAMGDPRIHAALVCAARSCPPLRREAYVAGRLDEQLDDNLREWLANPLLNSFDPSSGKAEISPIFKWYRKDFDGYPGGLDRFLRKYAPRQFNDRLGNRQIEIGFLSYDWGLNDKSGLGRHYNWLQSAIDRIGNWLHSL